MNERRQRGRSRTSDIIAEVETEVEIKQAPVPVDRMIRSGMVKVRAARALAEYDGRGNLVHRAKGDVFEIDPDRATAIGSLVTRIE